MTATLPTFPSMLHFTVHSLFAYISMHSVLTGVFVESVTGGGGGVQGVSETKVGLTSGLIVWTDGQM